MSSISIAGSADDWEYAQVERLCDLLLGYLPTCTVVKHRKHPSEWPTFAGRLQEVLGVNPVTSPLVWTSCGRVIGGTNAFAVHVFRKYGILCDLSRKQLESYAAVNLAESVVDLERDKVAKVQSGKRALIVVDVQNDFCKGGALAVPQGDDVIPVINTLLRSCTWDLVVYTQDFHPPGHASFASANRGARLFETRTLPGLGEQVMWPDHCVQGSLGAEFHPYLTRSVPCPTVVVQKGKSMKADSYSGFGDAKGHTIEKTELEDVLRDNDIDDVYVCGLALDYCVAYTAKDAMGMGFNTFLVHDATRAITSDGGVKATDDLAGLGVHIVRKDTVPYKSANEQAGADDSSPV